MVPSIEPSRILLAASGAAMVLLAAWLLAIDLRKRANRAFAVFLVARGIAIMIPQFTLSEQATRIALAVQPFFVLAILPAILFFASVYPRPRGPLGRPWGGLAMLVMAAALDAAYAWDNRLFHSIAPGAATLPALQAGPYLQYTDFGPLAVLTAAAFPVLSAVGLMVLLEYLRAPAGLRRTTHLLVAAGFMLNALFDGARGIATLVDLAAGPPGYPWLPWGWAIPFLQASSLVPALAGLAVLARHTGARARPDGAYERRLLVLCPLALASGLLPLWLAAAWPPGFLIGPWSPVVLASLGLWRLSVPALVAFALLHYGLFDIDRRTRRAITVVFALGAYLLAYWLVASLVGLVAPWYIAGAAASMVATALLLAARPVGAFSRRAALLLVPETHTLQPRLRYGEQRRLILDAGPPTPRERATLERLRRAGEPAP
jgi:hypothetical protein